MDNAAVADQKRPFITLGRGPRFVLFWTGGPGVKCPDYKGEKIQVFLDRTFEKMKGLRKSLNEKYEELADANPTSKTKILRHFLGVGHWAFATAMELRPYMEYYRVLPTNTLYVDYIYRLEEIYCKCFTAAHLFGESDESLVGLRGLLTDFEIAGGIAPDGNPGSGIMASELSYYSNYNWLALRTPILYRRYPELMEALAEMVIRDYPAVAKSLGFQIKYRLESKDSGFGNPEIFSPEKSEMLQKLRTVVWRLYECAEKVERKKA